MAKRKISLKSPEALASEYEALLDRCGDGVIITDEAGVIERANQMAGNLLKISPSAAIGAEFNSAIRSDEVIGLWLEVQENGTVQNREVRGGARRASQVIISIYPIGNKKSGKRKHLLIARDVTQLRKLETIRRDFVANVSHELRTPLASIRAMAETLQDGALSDEEVASKFLATIVTETERLTRIAEDLLILSDAESRLPEKTYFSLSKLIREVVSRLRSQAEKVDLILVEDFADNIMLGANHDQIEQVLVNLIDNAIKYTPSGGNIIVSAEAKDETVSVFIRDTGIGIKKKDLPRIFERFYRVDKARSRQSGGTGLGLSIVKHIVESHGGSVAVASEPNSGSTFSFKLSELSLPTP